MRELACNCRHPGDASAREVGSERKFVTADNCGAIRCGRHPWSSSGYSPAGPPQNRRFRETFHAKTRFLGSTFAKSRNVSREIASIALTLTFWRAFSKKSTRNASFFRDQAGPGRSRRNSDDAPAGASPDAIFLAPGRPKMLLARNCAGAAPGPSGREKTTRFASFFREIAPKRGSGRDFPKKRRETRCFFAKIRGRAAPGAIPARSDFDLPEASPGSPARTPKATKND